MTSKVIGVKFADLRVSVSPHILVSRALGSCVAIMLYDPQTKVGGLAHIMLPSSSGVRNCDNPGKFADTALQAMLDEMRKRGAKKTNCGKDCRGSSHVFNIW